ncbi:hypothetical protein NpPPO83_00004817 [Neofusicoccum parvum]|uniref:Uncharacterized protein n=1 Tax=Neofusicoccum parvum TaxID=310453 RepID=A0ACB5RUF4_9PEZI|nr:hypothetical protein NpPPO83_00004817 [Neofusicoccum parvum]
MPNHASIRLPIPGPGTGVHTLHWHHVHSPALPTRTTHSSARFHVFTGTAIACALAIDVQYGIEGVETLPGGVEVIEAVNHEHVRRMSPAVLVPEVCCCERPLLVSEARHCQGKAGGGVEACQNGGPYHEECLGRFKPAWAYIARGTMRADEQGVTDIPRVLCLSYRDELGDGYYDVLAPLDHWDALGRPIHADVEDVILHHRDRDQVKKDYLRQLEDADTGED